MLKEFCQPGHMLEICLFFRRFSALICLKPLCLLKESVFCVNQTLKYIIIKKKSKIEECASQDYHLIYESILKNLNLKRKNLKNELLKK